MIRMTLTVLVALVAPLTVHAVSADVQLLKQARSQIRIISGELQQHVRGVIAEQGAENALSACRLRSSGIIERLSAEGGWVIRRTALQVRNPENAPDQWEKDVLELFAERARQGIDLSGFEFAKVVNRNGTRVFRYMKPILMQEGCLSCHGPSPSPDIMEKINRTYPGDMATGFAVGDMRGAFSLLKMLPGDPPEPVPAD